MPLIVQISPTAYIGVITTILAATAIAKAIRYAVQHGAQVINMSFGVAGPSNSIRSAIQYAQLGHGRIDVLHTVKPN